MLLLQLLACVTTTDPGLGLAPAPVDTGAEALTSQPMIHGLLGSQLLTSGATLDLGHQPEGGRFSLTFTLVNPRDEAVDLSLALDGLSLEVGPPDSLDAYGSADVRLVVDATLPGPVSATLGVGIVGEDTLFELSLNGVVDPPPVVALVGGQGRILSSDDGGLTWPHDQWDPNAVDHDNTLLRGAAWGGGRFVAVGGNDEGTFRTSTDGLTWTTPFTGTRGWVADVAYGDGRFVAVGGFGNLAWSLDGQSWVESHQDYDTHLRQVAYGNGLFVAVGGDRRAVTADGIEWISDQTGFAGVDRITFGDGVFVAVGASGRIATTTDGVTWIDQTLGTTNRSGVAYGGGRFVTGGWPDGQLWSTDGQSWTEEEGNTWVAPCGFVNGLFIGSTWHDVVWTSPDGVTWTQAKPDSNPEMPGFSDCAVQGVGP